MEQPEMQIWRLDPTGLPKPNESRWLMGTGPAFDCQEAAAGF